MSISLLHKIGIIYLNFMYGYRFFYARVGSLFPREVWDQVLKYKMSALSSRLPDSLHEQIKKPAEQDEISINRFISSAIAEKMSDKILNEMSSDVIITIEPDLVLFRRKELDVSIKTGVLTDSGAREVIFETRSIFNL